jgi:CBS domain-containing protein
MARTASEIMETQVLTVSPESPLVDVQRLFVEEEIHGAPVVGNDGALVGVITSADILRAVSEEHGSGGVHSTYLRDVLEFSSPDWTRMPEDFQDRLTQLSAEEFMTREVVSVTPDASVSEVAQEIGRSRVHRVCVVDGEDLVGIISTFDMVALLEKQE